ncbi:head GIN domain-containing protein [uncultured Draconibacterium sp.]|uniref:head GIN domain-containing protein n=1 Tax=uncultured Draconibacterium sp. TaxID=1573823 RepID=UPI002AA79979|nr:head GIN domain-containing protein [uncultured Draconibacterium sp.]
MKTIKLFIYGLAMTFAASSCIDDITVEGNGIQGTEARIVTEFERVKSSGEFDVHITEASEYDVVISADENLLQYIETYVAGETLHIDEKGIRDLRNRVPMEVFVSTPVLNGIKQSGSGIITTDYFVSDEMDVVLSGSGKIITAFEAEEVDALISGSGTIEFSGFADDADFVISGSGNINASQLDLLYCTTSTSGSGDMYIAVSRNLKSNISGSGNVFYYGNPGVETHISGSGNVISQN